MLGIIDANCLRRKQFLTFAKLLFFLACFKNTLKTRVFPAAAHCFLLSQFTEFLLFRTVQLSLASFSALSQKCIAFQCISVALIEFSF